MIEFPTISDKEKVIFLENQQNKLVTWLRKQIEITKLSKVPEPHPLDFAMVDSDEEAQARVVYSRHNMDMESKIAAYERVLYEILILEESKEKAFSPKNNFDI